MTLWERVQQSVLRHEGGLSLNPHDRGNWTTGVVGQGELKGTNFGISAMSYPDLDIKNLTRDQAIAIYKRDFWDLIPSDLPDGLRWMAFDAAVNHGPHRALSWLKTHHTVAEYAAARLRFYTALGSWEHFGAGWTRRIAGLLEEITEWGERLERLERADTVVFHGFGEPIVIRNNFVWRSRGAKIDIRRDPPLKE